MVSGVILMFLVIGGVLGISNNNLTVDDLPEKLLNLSNVAIQGRQSSPYYPQYYPPKYPPYYQKQPQQQYGYPYPYQENVIHNYPEPLYKPPFITNPRETVMDALFSIAQNDDLQCVPKLLCEITSGGLTGRQNGLGLPINLNLESLATLISGINSANMSPVIHFGKAAVLGFTSKGNTRSCDYAYPECPADQVKLIKYLNNHNGGFFRFFQGLNPGFQSPQNYAQYYGYKPGYAEKRIQNKPSFDVNGLDNHGKDVGESLFTYTSPNIYEAVRPQKVAFPEQHSTSYSEDYPLYPPLGSASKSLKFPVESSAEPYRSGKKLQFFNDEPLDIQRPLPNHVPNPNIFPDRTGTGELKLDLDDVPYQQNYYDVDQYNQLLLDSFPSNANQRPSKLSFPDK